jgi:hypothetical protein
VLQTYRDHWPLTIRQIFYRLVGVYGYDKTDRAYRRLCDVMVLARRAQMIPFKAIRDDGWTRQNSDCWTDPDHAWEAFFSTAESYTKDKRTNQPANIYLLCEAAGMLPQLARVADRYSVPVMSSGGFDSLTVKYDLASEVLRKNKPAIFLHVGDYDPSGVCIFDSLAADVIAFCGQLASFERIALTPEQISAYDLPTAPAKATDKRGNNVKDTCQAEALPPDILAGIIDQAIGGKYDLTVFKADQLAEEEEKRELLSRLEL